jgi:hypothetical protein
MADFTLMPSQRAYLFESINARGLDPHDFTLVDVESDYTHDEVTELRLGGSRFFFRFDRKRTGAGDLNSFAEFSPGRDTMTEFAWPRSWPGFLQYFEDWLDRLIREIETPDLWEALKQERALIDTAASQNDGNTQFSQEERIQISGAINELKVHIFETQHLLAEHRDFVEVRLNYLEGAADRQGKTDWLQTAIGVLFTIVMILPQPQQAARELFRHFGALLSGIFGGGTPLLP